MTNLNRPPVQVFPQRARPYWAVALIQLAGTFSMAFLGLYLLSGQNCQFLGPAILAFGLLWVFFGFFTLCFSWALPLQYSRGVLSRENSPWAWYAICLGAMASGLMCVIRSVPFWVQMATTCH